MPYADKPLINVSMDSVAAMRDVQGLIRKCNAVGVASQDMKEVMQEVQNMIIERATIPYLTGALEASVRGGKTKNKAVIRAGNARTVPYAAPDHWGWPARNIAPNPWLAEARDDNIPEALKIIRQGMTDLLIRHSLI